MEVKPHGDFMMLAYVLHACTCTTPGPGWSSRQLSSHGTQEADLLLFMSSCDNVLATASLLVSLCTCTCMACKIAYSLSLFWLSPLAL